MYNDQVDRYAIEVGGIRDELMSVISSSDENLAEEMLLRPGGLKDLGSPNPDILKRASVMLGKAPGQIRQTSDSLGRKDPEKLLRILVTAVALTNMASQAIRRERQFEYVVGRGYREAARYVAENVMNRTEDLSKNIETVLGRLTSVCRFSPRTEPVFSPRSEPLLIMDFGSYWGQGRVCLLLFPGCSG